MRAIKRNAATVTQVCRVISRRADSRRVDSCSDDGRALSGVCVGVIIIGLRSKDPGEDKYLGIE